MSDFLGGVFVIGILLLATVGCMELVSGDEEPAAEVIEAPAAPVEPPAVPELDDEKVLKRIHFWKDPKYGCEYIVLNDWDGPSIEPRLDSAGVPLCPDNNNVISSGENDDQEPGGAESSLPKQLRTD